MKRAIASCYVHNNTDRHNSQLFILVLVQSPPAVLVESERIKWKNTSVLLYFVVRGDKMHYNASFWRLQTSSSSRNDDLTTRRAFISVTTRISLLHAKTCLKRIYLPRVRNYWLKFRLNTLSLSWGIWIWLDRVQIRQSSFCQWSNVHLELVAVKTGKGWSALLFAHEGVSLAGFPQ